MQEEYSNGPFPWRGTWAAEFADFKTRFHDCMDKHEAMLEQEALARERVAKEEQKQKQKQKEEEAEMSDGDGYSSDARTSRTFRQ